MIELKKISKTYILGGDTVHAVDELSLTIEEHEFVAIIGASGSGKSTLMNIIGCLDAVDEGQYLLRGQDISSYTDRQMSTLRNREIGFVFQQFNLLQKLTALENVELPLIYQGMGLAQRKKRAVEALVRVGLESRMHHRPNQLSGGQQQRVAIARAIVTRPSLILADEPTGNLDSRSSKEILELLHELYEAGNTVLLITHDIHTASEAKRRVRLVDGRIVMDSKYDDEAAFLAEEERAERLHREAMKL
ncbi:MAG: ABC transporter ATP-binding protein [Eubacteriales bacterium]